MFQNKSVTGGRKYYFDNIHEVNKFHLNKKKGNFIHYNEL